MAAERDYGLYRERAIGLATLPGGSDTNEFWDALADKAVRADQGGIAIRLELFSASVVRVERTNEMGTHVAVHMAIYGDVTSAGKRIRLQPLVAWRIGQIGTGRSELMSNDNPVTQATVEALRNELPQLAEGLR